ncbi:hypothetical protein GCM10010359_49110 [Streptomyces morookaense]|nr:hypothetical protein GCM10010359_49110 [Streptomyces morookaense]
MPLITGVTGQDGSYLADHLLAEGCQVWGLTRGQANPRKDRVAKLIPDLSFVHGDLTGLAVRTSDLTVRCRETWSSGPSCRPRPHAAGGIGPAKSWFSTMPDADLPLRDSCSRLPKRSAVIRYSNSFHFAFVREVR